MNSRIFSALFTVLLLTGCASGGPKTVLIENSIPPEKAAVVHPTVVPGGLMLVRSVGGRSTYTMSVGYLGSVYVPPGHHDFEVEVSHGFGVQDAGGPAWTAPEGVITAPLVGETPNVIFVTKGASRPRAEVQPGKTYEIKFGFDRSNPDQPVPVTWISEIPSK